MKIKDIPIEILEPGIRVQFFRDPSKRGTLVEVNGPEENPTCYFQWDERSEPTYSCTAQICDLEIVKLFEMNIDGHLVEVINCWWVGKDFHVHDFDNKIMVYTNAWFEHSSQGLDLEGDPSVTTTKFNYVPVKAI